MIGQEKIQQEYYNGSSVFVKLCQSGNLPDLVNYVFNGEHPYINHVPSKEKLTRNAIMFFCIGKHQSAINDFFNSPFMEFFDKIDKLEPIKTLISNESNDLIKLIISKLTLSEDDYKNLLFSACEYKSNSTKFLLNNYIDVTKLTQDEKLNCFLNLIKNENKKDNQLGLFNFLEIKFSDFLYHQKDDILTTTAVNKEQWDVVSYLMFDKKLRITKHLNALSWGNRTFSEMVEKRKYYDSLTMKMNNKKFSEPQKIKKNKI